MSIKLGTSDLARYPFLTEAATYFKENCIDLEEFNRPEMEYIIERAVNRIAKENEGNVDLSIEKFEVEILTFFVCLLIVKYIGVESLMKKFALFEAMRTEKFLKEDLKKIDENKVSSLLFKIFKDLFDFNVLKDNKNNLFRINIIDYLKRTSNFHEKEWKIINKTIHDGFVFLDSDDVVRLVRNELSLLILDRIKKMNVSYIPEKIIYKSKDLKSKILDTRSYWSSSKSSEFAPCVLHALKRLKNGENLPHSARFLLATYMLNMGKEINEIAEIFKTAPDYNEKITLYQIEHLAGKKGASTKYSVPSCEKLITENLCYPDMFCKGIVNPVQYKKRKNI